MTIWLSVLAALSPTRCFSTLLITPERKKCRLKVLLGLRRNGELFSFGASAGCLLVALPWLELDSESGGRRYRQRKYADLCSPGARLRYRPSLRDFMNSRRADSLWHAAFFAHAIIPRPMNLWRKLSCQNQRNGHYRRCPIGFCGHHTEDR